jgi:hypothetical protein
MSQGNSRDAGGQWSTNNKASVGATRSKSRIKSNVREDTNKVEFERTRKVPEITGKITDVAQTSTKVYKNHANNILEIEDDQLKPQSNMGKLD